MKQAMKGPTLTRVVALTDDDDEEEDIEEEENMSNMIKCF